MKRMWTALLVGALSIVLLSGCWIAGLGPDPEEDPVDPILSVQLTDLSGPTEFDDGDSVPHPLVEYYENSNTNPYQLENTGNVRLYFTANAVTFANQYFLSRNGTDDDTLTRFEIETPPEGYFIDPGNTAEFVVRLNRINEVTYPTWGTRGTAQADLEVHLVSGDGDAADFTYAFYADIC